MTGRYAHQAVIEASGFYPYLQAFLQWGEVKGLSRDTQKRRQSALRRFIHWCSERDLQRPQEVTKPILERYQRHLYHYRKSDGQPLSHGSQCGLLTPLKAFFKWLARENHILYNPASELELPKRLKGLPKVILSQQELAALFSQPDLERGEGIRDRAILELFYSTGMRSMELVNLKTHDLDINRHLVMIRRGKGGKDRFIPAGERALRWVAHYRDEVRPEWVTDQHEETLFLNRYGEPIRRSTLSKRVKRYLQLAGIEVAGSCHLLRHAMATHMLENGADVRIIQALLGHEDLNTTQIYTRVSIKKLAQIHAATHPAGGEREAKQEEETLPDSAE
ncbi:MAG: site-specific tyrosine recombinase XerC [Candidatus Thiodiazotropha sp.]|jgi:integrase/recombinase XerD